MNAYERVTTVLNGSLPDCVPAMPVLLIQGAAEIGADLVSYYQNGALLAEGQLALYNKFQHDAVYGFPHVVEDITAFGAELMYYEDGPPGAAGMIIETYEDALQLPVPNPSNVPLLQETLHAIEQLASRVKGEVPIVGAVIAPFSLPSMLMGTEAWMNLLLFEEPETRTRVMGHLLETGRQFATAWANAQLAAGADVIVLADGMSSASVITREQFIEFALDTVNATVAGINGPVIHEGVGDLYPLLDLLTGSGVIGAIVTCDDNLEDSRAQVGEHLTLIGNLNNIELLRWSVDEAAQQADQALAAGAPYGRFILSTQGPEIPLDASDAVIQTLVDRAHNWRY